MTNADLATVASVQPTRRRAAHRHARVLAVVLLVLWIVAGARRSLVLERAIPRGVADPYATTTVVGATGVEPAWEERLTTIRRAAALAGDAHRADAPALVVVPAVDSLAATFLLYQLAHVWYPQPVAATAGGEPSGVAAAAARPALLYVLDGASPPRSVAAGAPVARFASVTVYRVAR